MATRKSVDSRPAVAKTSAGGSGRHLPRSSIACTNCRTRKVKCDVQKQIKDGICTKCRVANVECIVIHDDDRRKSGYQRHIAGLKDRLQSLESMMVHHLRQNSEEAGEQSHRVHEHEIHPSPVPRSDSAPSSPCTYMSPSLSSQGAEANPLLFNPTTECSTVEAEASPAATGNRLSWPEGMKSTDAPDNPDPSKSSVPGSNLTQVQLLSSSVLAAEEDVGNEAALNLDSSQVQKVLLEIAWRCLSLQTRLVHEQYFLSHRDLGVRSQYYSPFLENTLLACASRMSTSTAIRNLGTSYIDRAVKDIPMELENPTLSTVQGLLLLADFEATRDRDRLGWTYMGIACRLLLFGSSWDDWSEPLVSKKGLALGDFQCRYTVYLSTFVYDTLWSFYLGRPRTMSLPMLCAARDSVQTTLDNRILCIWVDLCVLIAELSDVLSISHPQARDVITQLLDLDSRIQNASEALPSDLAYRQMSSVELDTAGYAYHMQLYSTRITLHRALIKASVETETPQHEKAALAGGIFRYTPEFSSKTMYDSAVCIAELAITYRQIFGPDRMITVMLNTIYMAAIALINHVLVMQRHGVYAESDIKRIRQLVDTLDQVQTHFPVASRIHHTLSEILSGASSPSLLDCIPTGLTQAKSSSQPRVRSYINSWRVTGTPVESHPPPVALDFSGMFDERNPSWIPDMGDTFTIVS